MNIINPKNIKNLLSTDECILGVSGGLDSMCLLDWFYKNPDHVPNKWRVIHVNHNISTESSKWADFVKAQCDLRNIQCDVISVDTLGSKISKNLEYAARHARYEAFSAQPEKYIVLAHHQNDQVETFFLKLFRGSGIKGLRGMVEKCQGWMNGEQLIVRPMLGISRAQLEHYAEQNNIQYVQDPSNSDTSYDRNWIRHLLWPVIEQRYGIADVNIQRCMRFIGENWELSQDLAKIDFDACNLTDNIISWPILKELSALRIKNVLIYVMDHYNVTSYSTHQVELWASSIKSADVNSNIELRVKGLSINKRGNKLFLSEAN